MKRFNAEEQRDFLGNEPPSHQARQDFTSKIPFTPFTLCDFALKIANSSVLCRDRGDTHGHQNRSTYCYHR